MAYLYFFNIYFNFFGILKTIFKYLCLETKLELS